ncbi:replication-relaxation family protein [Streptomyces mayteni]
MPPITDRGVEHEVRILQLLACTRVATPDQLHAWLTPRAVDTSTVRRCLNRMRKAGLVAANTVRRPNIWFLTEAGLAEARRAGLAAHRTTAVTGEHVAASPAFAHALAVTTAAIACSRNLAPEARHGTALAEVGDWEVEVAHPLGSEGLLVPDAVLHLPYSNLPHAFVEVDRATMSIGRLITKVAAYDSYRTHRTPAGRRPAATDSETGRLHWRARYPRAGHRFPPLLIVLTDKAPAILAARRIAVLDGIPHLPGVRRSQLAVAITTLAAIQEQGALSAIWQTAHRKASTRRLAEAVGDVEATS